MKKFRRMSCENDKSEQSQPFQAKATRVSQKERRERERGIERGKNYQKIFFAF